MNQLSREEEESLVKALERVVRLQLAERQRQAFLERIASMNVPPSSPTEPMETSNSSSGPRQTTATPTEPMETVSSESLPDTQPVEEVFDLTAEGSSQAFTVSNEDKQEKVECDEGCGKTFSTRKDMKRHLRRVHIALTYQCTICDKTFKTRSNKKKHMESCVKKQKKTPSDSHSKTRKRKRSEPSSGESPVKKKQKVDAEDVPMRDVASTSRDTPSTSGMQTHSDLWNLNADGASENLREDPASMPEDIQNQIPDNFQTIYSDNWKAIRTHHHRQNRVQDTYNFRITDLSNTSMRDLVRLVHNDQSNQFKLNMSFGFILRNRVTGDLRYFHASVNNHRLFDYPIMIGSQGDLNSFLEQFDIEDIEQTLLLGRPDSKWVLDFITNVTIFVNKLGNHPLVGGPPPHIPDYINKHQHLVTMSHHRKTNQPFQDNLCLFRCLSYHLKSVESACYDRTPKALFQKYQTAIGGRDGISTFKGISLNELGVIEKIFGCNIYVYELKPSNKEPTEEAGNKPTLPSETVAELVRRSPCRYASTMYLNIFEGHFSYIKDMNYYAQSFHCVRCRRLFQQHRYLNQHIPRCKEHVEYHYPGGVFQLTPTVFDKLETLHILVQPSERFYPFRITYDIETYLDKHDVIQSKGPKLQYIGQHKLLSISVCSNVPGYQAPQCFISEGDDLKLVETFTTYCTEISQAAFERVSGGGSIAMAIDTLKGMIVNEERRVVHIDDAAEHRYLNNVLKPTMGSLLNYCRQIPVIGFNSGKYDINVMKGLLYKSIHTCNEGEESDASPITQVIKRNSDYMCISAKWFKFLDIKNYLAPGCSYKQFLEAYKCKEAKGFFPYDWVDSLDKLSEPSLPPHEAFYNKLKACNISDEEYRYCQALWQERHMETFRDFLIWYNNKDVVPFLEALDKMFDFYKSKDIDMFKQGISVPGLTLRYLFKDIKNDFFCLFPNAHHDLYHLFRDNIVGGPSIIFHRYHERDLTKLRGGKVCKQVLGFDANALYLWAVMQHMPTGVGLRRREEMGFRREFTHNLHKTAAGWLEWEAKMRGIKIKHRLNGKEVRVGKRQLPVDGFGINKGKPIILQFQGCYWHGHSCSLNQGKTHNHVKNKPLSELFEETKAITNYLKS
ncbi:hypothetical protein HOLleu_00491 [Holothuria leucospilota]|uniref:C2H2-type domain-containing protein n=1 Tax=Holothuria leucospilota TaxID=206669 RepID=A0A9Q1CP20_HOLLE|nr:hypothetical protein HOLleu_00491 [Holothuria leucospilota]